MKGARFIVTSTPWQTVLSRSSKQPFGGTTKLHLQLIQGLPKSVTEPCLVIQTKGLSRVQIWHCQFIKHLHNMSCRRGEIKMKRCLLTLIPKETSGDGMYQSMKQLVKALNAHVLLCAELRLISSTNKYICLSYFVQLFIFRYLQLTTKEILRVAHQPEDFIVSCSYRGL